MPQDKTISLAVIFILITGMICAMWGIPIGILWMMSGDAQ